MPLLHAVLIAVMWLYSPMVFAADSVRGERAGTSARLVFPDELARGMQASVDGQQLTVVFEKPVDPDFKPALRALSPYLLSAERKADGKTLVFTLDRPYAIRAFAGGGQTGVELLHVTEIASAPAAPVHLAELAPAAGPSEEKPAPAETAAGGETPQPDAASPPDRFTVSVSPAADNAVLRFPFTDRAAMAVFVRARFLWIAWNKTLPADLSDFENLPRTVIGKAELVKADGATVIRMPVDDGAVIEVAREQETFDWAVLVMPKAKRGMSKALPAYVNTDPPAPAHVFVPALETADPVTVIDPQVGDRLVITPFFSVGEGVARAREFVDFSLLKTVQGLAVLAKADDVAVTPLRNGLRISRPEGAVLTPGLATPEPEPQAADASQQTLTLFPYEFWKPAVAAEQQKQLRDLFRRIVSSENAQDANNARLRVAQLHLSDGLAAEAIAFLDGINRTNPAFYRSSKLAALRGAANFLMYRFTDAAKDFSASELNNNREVDYWRSMLGDLLGNPDQSYDYLALNADYISKYPPVFRQRLAIVAADRAIGSKDFNTAMKIFDTLTQDNLAEPVGPYVNFLMAKISAETGQEEEAFEVWGKLAEDLDHPFVRARAEFARILWEMDRNTLAKDKAIDRLERLRISWHGDSLEMTVLTMLGDLYLAQRDYVNAMRIWHGGVLSFPNTATAFDMSRKMQEAFMTMFSEGIADQLPPLEAIALYYEYKNYMPGGAAGNEIISKLADRLISVDLLGQAATLLDQQMRFASEKEARSEIGARLAGIYLLNNQPTKALSTLQDSVYGDNPLMLRLQRNRLAAQAMVEMGESEKALLTLGQDNSLEAERVRIQVYWREKNWRPLMASVERLLKERSDITAPVTLEESEYLLRLALAYVFENERTQLQYLHDYFTPLMNGNPNKDIFAFITGGDIELTTRNFDDLVQKVSDTRTFIQNYRARVVVN